MSRYFMKATISVEAETPEEALYFGRALCNTADRIGLGDCVLDEQESPHLDEGEGTP